MARLLSIFFCPTPKAAFLRDSYRPDHDPELTCMVVQQLSSGATGMWNGSIKKINVGEIAFAAGGVVVAADGDGDGVATVPTATTSRMGSELSAAQSRDASQVDFFCLRPECTRFCPECALTAP